MESEASADSAAELMRERLIGSLPVMDGDELVGIVTATDVFEALDNGARGPLSGAERQMLRAPSSSKRLGGSPIVRKRIAESSDVRRERPKISNRDKREPLTDQITRSEKRTAGRTTAPHVPANIRVSGVDLDDEDMDYIRQRLGLKLGKFASSIERVTVRVKDINGDRGGIDKICNIKVVVSGLPSVVVEGRSDSTRVAVNSALAAIESAVRRVVQRRRMTPLRVGAGKE